MLKISMPFTATRDLDPASRSTMALLLDDQRSQLRDWRSNIVLGILMTVSGLAMLWWRAYRGESNQTTSLLFALSIVMTVATTIHVSIKYVAVLRRLRGSLATLRGIRERQVFGATPDVTQLLRLLTDVLIPSDQLGDSAPHTVLARIVRDGHTVCETGGVELSFERLRACLHSISSDPALGSELQIAAASLLTRFEAGLVGHWIGYPAQRLTDRH